MNRRSTQVAAFLLVAGLCTVAGAQTTKPTTSPTTTTHTPPTTKEATVNPNTPGNPPTVDSTWQNTKRQQAKTKPAKSKPVIAKTKTTTTNVNTKTTSNTTSTSTPTELPGLAHLELTKLFIGEWSTTTTNWTSANATPVSFVGKASFFPSMGGRFVVGDFSGNVGTFTTTNTNTNTNTATTTTPGVTYRGLGIYGYNNALAQYETTWFDSTSTETITFAGTKIDSTTFNFSGTYTDPTTGQLLACRGVTTFNGSSGMTFTVYKTDTTGNEFKSVQVAYTRLNNGGPMELRAVAIEPTTKTNTRTTSVTEQIQTIEK